MSKQKSTQSTGIEDAIGDLIPKQGAMDDGEILVHFDLIAVTRRLVDGRDTVSRRHWSSPGADPHMSYGVLNAEAVRILKSELT